jgi:hypothetical protein
VFPETLETDRLRFERLCRETVSVREFYRRFKASASGLDPEGEADNA